MTDIGRAAAHGARTDERPPVSVEIDFALITRLRAEARRRDMPTCRLVRLVLDEVIERKLVSTLLGE